MCSSDLLAVREEAHAGKAITFAFGLGEERPHDGEVAEVLGLAVDVGSDIEDDAAVRETLKLVLELEGYSVATAENGREALSLLPEIPTPCLILLDLMMPVMNGWEMARLLQKDHALAAIPMAVVTAFSEQAGNVPGAKVVLKKPVDLEQLLQVVKKYCG